MLKKTLIVGAVLVVLGFAVYRLQTQPTNTTSLPTAILMPSGGAQESDIPRVSIVADNLEVPWAIAFLPDGGLLVTERKGTIKLVEDRQTTQIAEIKDVLQTGESGLHGIALHPEFEKNKFVYIYHTYSGEGNSTLNKVVRYVFDGTSFSNPKTIVNAIPGAIFHDGGRIKFGPDALLYITTGDALEPSLSQNRNSLAGKILRVTDTGEPAPGNPYDSRIYSYGHRNPQGIAWDEQGTLWETEHGQSATDEVNRIESGANYGWPEVTGDATRGGIVSPVIQSGNDTWAPAALAYANGSLYFGALRGRALYQVRGLGATPSLVKHLDGELGRIREVITGPDGMLYITTSNRDGRGTPAPDDDKILRINPSKL